MGLDMYLTGKKFYSAYENTINDDEGYQIEEICVRLGYWRKHSNLHGYIVNKFAEGEDNCQEIDLSLEDLNHLLEVVKDPTNNMEKTEGFFFGESTNDEDQIKEDMEIFTRAIGFLVATTLTKKDGSNFPWRSVVYRASW